MRLLKRIIGMEEALWSKAESSLIIMLALTMWFGLCWSIIFVAVLSL